MARLNPPGMAANRDVRYRVRVIEDPTLNAFAYPHGSIYIHTGLLARMESEDELATVLGHEMTHVENRHMLRYQRSAHNKEVGITVAAMTAAVVLAVAEGDALSDGDWGKAAVLRRAGQRPRRAGAGARLPGLGERLRPGAGERGGRGRLRQAGRRGLRPRSRRRRSTRCSSTTAASRRRMEAFFFGSHPRLSERSRTPGGTSPATPCRRPRRVMPAEPAEDAFARRLRPVVRDDARLNIEMGRLKIAEGELDEGAGVDARGPRDPLPPGAPRLAQAADEKEPADQRRLRREAEDAFLKSIELDPRRPTPHRELGLLLYERKQFADACIQLRRYAQLAPEAEDVPHVEDYVQEMEQDGRCR